MLISQMQRDMLGPLGLVGPKEGFALFSDIAKTMGFEMPDKFAMNPDSPEYQQKLSQPQQPPLPVQLEQMKIQADGQKHQAEMQADIQKFQAETQMTRETEQIKADAKLQEIRANLELQAANDQRDSEREQMKAQVDAALESQRLEFEKWKAELDARVKLRIAQIGTEQSGDELMSELGDAFVMNEPSPIDRLAQMHAETLQGIAALAEQMARPKQIVRDASGRAQGVA
jgi:hypothetical protein